MATIQFTTLIRLPFARGDFIDPPQADWNAAKDRALWKVISKSSKTSDLNWAELATRFQVPQAFLLQQAAWLYERHLEHVRSQMKKVNVPTTSGNGSSHTPSIVGGIPLQRVASGGSRSSRTPSALSVRQRDGAVSRTEPSAPGTAVYTPPPSLSRTPSTNTITQSRAYSQSNPIRPQLQRPARPSITGPKPATPTVPSTESHSQVIDADSPEATLSSSSSSSDSDQGPIHRSQLFKRPPRFQKTRPRDLLSYDEDADEGDDPEGSGEVVLPFAQKRGTTSVLGGVSHGTSNFPPAGTARQTSPSQPHEPFQSANTRREQATKTDAFDVSSSLASSASDAPKVSKPGPLSPRHRAELAKLNPRGSGTGSKKDGSEGVPSMGSSFSDIDDAGISQSALEEALLSNIHAGRMSTFSNLRSRYL